MQVSVSGQHLSIGLSLQEYVKERMGGSIKKYFDHAPSATVHFNKQKSGYLAIVIIFRKYAILRVLNLVLSLK